MITSMVSAMGGPMSLIVSGCLGGSGVGCGESGFGNNSHFSRYAQQRYSLGNANQPRDNTIEQSLSCSGSRSPSVI